MPPRTAVLPREGAVGAEPSLPWMGGSVLVDVGLPEDVWVTPQGLQRAVQARVELGLDEGTTYRDALAAARDARLRSPGHGGEDADGAADDADEDEWDEEELGGARGGAMSDDDESDDGLLL